MKNTSTKTTIAYLRTRKLLIICSFLLASALGRAQSAIEFHGGGAYAELGTVSPAGNFSSGLTIECWVKWDAFNTWSRIIDFGNGAGDDNILFANESNGSNLRFEVYNEGSQLGVSSPVEMVTGRWYHVAVTQTPDGLATIYIDGNPVASETIFTPFDVARTQCYIGKSGWDGDGYFQGKIDELRIWNTARTHSEIRKHMLKPVAVNASGLVGYYRFNENSGMTTANSGTNGGAGNGNFVDGLAWTSSPVQQAPNAITFDGIDDHMAIG
ncbi:MAG TPA: LamG domain-containing protein, partial [Chitinophagaceae bacterium]|nr:LamG domain-containing protein [Chitinophagaceae bacterium]